MRPVVGIGDIGPLLLTLQAGADLLARRDRALGRLSAEAAASGEYSGHDAAWADWDAAAATHLGAVLDAARTAGLIP
jgi:hypothetical protein